MRLTRLARWALATGCALALAAGVARAQPAAPAQIYAQLQQLQAGGAALVTGPFRPERTVYVIMDLRCPHCTELWHTAQSFVDRVRFVWVPVQLISPASGLQAAVVLASPQPAAALEAHEKDRLAGKDGVVFKDHPDAVGVWLPKVQRNTKWFVQDLRIESVPYVLVPLPNGRFNAAAGAPSAAQLAQLLALPPR